MVATPIDRVWKLFENGDRICRHQLAINDKGEVVHPTLTEANKLCTAGALAAIYGHNNDLYMEKCKKLQAKIGCIILWHDKTSDGELLTVLKELDI